MFSIRTKITLFSMFFTTCSYFHPILSNSHLLKNMFFFAGANEIFTIPTDSSSQLILKILFINSQLTISDSSFTIIIIIVKINRRLYLPILKFHEYYLLHWVNVLKSKYTYEYFSKKKIKCLNLQRRRRIRVEQDETFLPGKNF